MLARLVDRLDDIIGIAVTSQFDQALVRERIIALKRQMPWMHGMLLASLAGIMLALPPKGPLSISCAVILFALIVIRAPYILRLRLTEMPARLAQRELRLTLLTTSIFCLVSLTWQFSLYRELSAEDGADVAMFAGIAALGASAGLSSFPAAARIPMLFGAAPFAALLTLSHKPSHQAIGLTFLVVIAVRLRLLKVQDLTFERLVGAHFSLEIEKRRAVHAEQEAITEQLRAEDIANKDQLTGLINRRGFLAALENVSIDLRTELALILLDLDGFKPINDTFGHLIGDQVLIEVSQRLRLLGAGELIVARLGGDEFALVCRCETAGQAVIVAKEAVAQLGAPYLVDGREMRISACAGVSFQGDASHENALRRADIALYDAKRRMRGGVSLFSDQMEHDVQRRTAIEQALREPRLASDIRMAFQPIFELQSLQLSSFEALARWHHPQLGWISPSEFIPISEQMSVLQELSEALLARAAAAACRWPTSVALSFNLSPVELCSPATASKVLKGVAQQKLDPTRLLIEVTETALLADFKTARANLSELREAGVRIVLDDFGSGYSTISYLREMNFDAIKLDGSLVSAATTSQKGARLLEGVLALCHAIGQQCVAEYIENDEQLQLLRKLGCKFGQGFGLCQPLSELDALDLVHSGALRTARAGNGPHYESRVAHG